MVCHPVRFALLIGALAAVAVNPARAQHHGGACSPCGPTTRTIQVTECVPETYTVKRTVYKTECRTEEYDTFRCETVQVQKERTVCCVKRVPVTREEVRKVCCNVTVCEDREVCKKKWVKVEETVMKKRCVRLGHWECRETVHCGHRLFGHRNSCDPCAQPCCTTRTHRHWVHCPVYECCPVKVCKRVCVEEKCIVKVPVCKQIWKEEKVKVCTYECVKENRVEKYTVCETRKVPCKATRTVRVCVPYTEDVKCTRYVTRCVTREVPCAPVCCDDCCRPSLHDRLRACFSHGCRDHGNCCR